MTYRVGKLPPIRVGPHLIRFGWLDGDDAQKNHGMYIPAEQMIRLQREFSSGSMAVETVVHEVMHAIFNVGSIVAKQGEEHIVSCTGALLTQIIRDNPKFMKWMQEAVKK